MTQNKRFGTIEIVGIVVPLCVGCIVDNVYFS